MRDLPPRGRAAPTVQMNDDTLYSIAIVEASDGKVQFSVPDVDVYMAVQVVTEGGHGQHYVVDAGDYDLPVENIDDQDLIRRKRCALGAIVGSRHGLRCRNFLRRRRTDHAAALRHVSQRSCRRSWSEARHD